MTPEQSKIIDGIYERYPSLKFAQIYCDEGMMIFNAGRIFKLFFWKGCFNVAKTFSSDGCLLVFEYTPEGSQRFFAFLEDYIPKRMQELLLKD